MTVDLAAEVRRGQEAKSLLAHPLLEAAFSEVKQKLISGWETTPIRDVDGREVIFLMLKGLELVKGAIETHVTTGKMAEISLKQEAELHAAH